VRSTGGLLVLVASASLATSVLAQTPPPPAGPAVGASASYRWTSSITQPVTVLVEERPSAGAPAKWSVVQERAAPQPVYVTYSVVRADRATYTIQIVTRERLEGTPLSVTHVTVNRASGKAVRSLTRTPTGPKPTPESGLRPVSERAVPQGRRDEVTVPAGRFEAVQGKLGPADVWVSDRVPPLGLVKGVWPQGTLELVESARTGARDLLRTATR
jgi:hypothetical protein